jgi:hypothetical protein
MAEAQTGHLRKHGWWISWTAFFIFCKAAALGTCYPMICRLGKGYTIISVCGEKMELGKLSIVSYMKKRI